MNHQFKCKFCGHTGTVQSLEGAMTEAQIESWIQALSCQRCAIFNRTKTDCEFYARQVAWGWFTFQKDKSKSQGAIMESRGRFQLALSSILRKLCRAYEVRFGLKPLFEPEMAETIMDNPQEAGTVLRQIQRTATSASQHPAAPQPCL